MAQRGSQQKQMEQEELKSSVEMWRTKFEELKQTLAEQQLSRAVQKRNMRCLIHVETLAELSSAQDALKESEGKYVALEEAINRLHEKDKRQQEELKEKEESVMKMLEEEHERELQERLQKLDEDQKMKEETMKQELVQQQEQFQKKLNEEKDNHDVKISEKDAWMKQQLMDREDRFKNLLTELRQPLENRAQQWVLEMKELQGRLQESNRRRQEQERKTNEEIKRLSEELFHLQELQAPKKEKKKRFWRWKFWKKKQ